MVNAIIIGENKDTLASLKKLIIDSCPQISFCGQASSVQHAHDLILNSAPELLFININSCLNKGLEIFKHILPGQFETIFMANATQYAIEAIRHCAAGYVLKPIKKEELILAISNAEKNIKQKKEYLRNKAQLESMIIQSSKDEVLGVPTIEGFLFIPIKEIIRCEGLRRYTRVITKEKTDIVSSSNLGEFRKKLEPHRFFSPHKSHLINLQFIRKYHREGSIIMLDGSYVPVAKRRKCEFLMQVNHL